MRKKPQEHRRDWEETLAERHKELETAEDMLEELQEEMEAARFGRGIPEAIRLKEWMREPLFKRRPI
jgi:hypothetical protein